MSDLQTRPRSMWEVRARDRELTTERLRLLAEDGKDAMTALLRDLDALAAKWQEPGRQHFFYPKDAADRLVAVLAKHRTTAAPKPSAVRPRRCPTCDSPDPKLHPAVQWEGDIQPCGNRWHVLTAQHTSRTAPLSEREERAVYVEVARIWQDRYTVLLTALDALVTEMREQDRDETTISRRAAYWADRLTAEIATHRESR
jgi:hypothetical protein